MGAKAKTTPVTTHGDLQAKFPGLDHKLKKRPIFRVQERDVRYRLENLGECKNIDYKVDGVLIPVTQANDRKCDHLLLVKVSDDHWIQVFIELKSKDVEHGLSQLVRTLEHALFNSPCQSEMRVARLVAKSMPSGKNNPIVEKFKSKLVRLKCPLKTFKPNQSEDFEKLRKKD
jgi:hypothetical protein